MTCITGNPSLQRGWSMKSNFGMPLLLFVSDQHVNDWCGTADVTPINLARHLRIQECPKSLITRADRKLCLWALVCGPGIRA